ncbi:Tetraspanin 39D [Carabus blaptoides fortunei]
MGCVSGLVNTIVFVFNFLCALVGLILIIVGSIFYVAIDEYYKITNNNLNVAPALVIAVGVIIFIIAFLGCCGVTQKSRWMLFTYATILLILFIIQIAAGIYGYVQVNDNDGGLKKEISKQVNKAFESYTDAVFKDVLDTMQRQLKCCGPNGKGWFPQDQVPLSCCELSDSAESCTSEKAYNEGCSTKLHALIVDSVKVVANVAFGICVIELIGAIFAIYLGRRIDNY